MAKFVLKNRYRSYKCCNGIGQCEFKHNNHLDLIVNIIGKVYAIVQEKGKFNLSSINFLHMHPNSRVLNNNLCDSKLLVG